MNSRSIFSVGVDVGTTSTHLTISKLTFANMSRPTEPSRTVIESREIVYESPIYFTPLTAEGIIDAAAVVQILQREYISSGLPAEEISTGAVIITGESAKKRNASEIVQELSQLAGKFVAASAGANMESVLAARGSGALAASKAGSIICNADIGGGTTNIAVCDNGEVVYVDCLSVGGRFCQIDVNHNVVSVNAAGEQLFRDVLGRSAIPGVVLTEAECVALSNKAAEMIFERLDNAAQVSQRLFEKICFSGGVADLINRIQPLQALQAREDREGTSPSPLTKVESVPDTAYGDMGVFLARQLIKMAAARHTNFVVPKNAIRAVVIGAGSYTLQLSGSTVAVGSGQLPIENVPIIRLPESTTPDSLVSDVRDRLLISDLDWSVQPIALLIPTLPRVGYIQLQNWANALAEAFAEHQGAEPLVVMCSHDVAAALGQMIGLILPGRDHIVLDGINNSTGDFVDIGELLPNAEALPVVIKEFVFN